MKTKLRLLYFFMALISFDVEAKTVRYELNVANTPVNMSGQKTVDFALSVNGGIPGPTLEFTEGDEAEILVRNSLKKEEVSIHWHGILLPPEEDGVAYVNTPPIFPGQSRLFKFKIRQHGTYWYHSHTALQEQKGVYGAIVIRSKRPVVKADRDVVLVLSDWSDENAYKILRNLKKDGDYYLYKKNSLRSLWGAISAGQFSTQIKNAWSRMGGMDLSDVGYDAFLVNGRRESDLSNVKPGERVRLRIINAAASTYFYVNSATGALETISADGVDIQPIKAKEILMGMAETYDVLLTVPDNKSYELRATAQDGTGHASFWIGSGTKVSAPERKKPDLYAPMNHGDHSSHGTEPNVSHQNHHDGHHGMHHDMHHEKPMTETLTVDELRSFQTTTLPTTAKITELKLSLGGDMERYVWHINGKAIFEDQYINIREGDIIRFTFENQTMMHHPMHLHGHFFRVLNGGGEKSPLKHTVDVPPHGTRTIEFYANEPGQWMLHCHNLYHMKTGMARVVRYMSYKPSPELAALEKSDPHRHDHLYAYGALSAFTNLGRAQAKIMGTWNEVDLGLESRDGDFEGDLLYRRRQPGFLSWVAGGTYFEDKSYPVAGIGYTLPLLIDTQLLVNHEGRFRLDLGTRWQWTSKLFSEVEFKWRPDWDAEHESEFDLSLMYGPSWNWAVGLMFTNESLGAGGQLQF